MMESSSGDSLMDVDCVEHAELMETVGDEDYFSDLSDSLILTNLPTSIFASDEAREKLDAILKSYDEEVSVIYFKSFRRARVTFSSNMKAAFARVHLNGVVVGGSEIGCFMAQPRMPSKDEEEHSTGHLMPPKPDKQFLISPPASPPVDWEQAHEAEPLINYDLLRAVTQLAPGEAHELHAPSEDQPAIIVHICEDTRSNGAALLTADSKTPKPPIVQTKCPDR